ncbi:MAG TPA: iron-containing redox enzyme family protein [Nitrospirales bacterium]|nr:iron-containing redox enzyme family protein [Nitrospirales bacterium]
MKATSAERFQERLLAIMDRKHHWAWNYFTQPGLTRAQLKTHFQQEYAVYVRDFPVFLARIHGQSPPASVRRMLAENIYEEDTGGLSLGRSHPELFLQMMDGLGLRERDFQQIALLPASRRYRAWLDDVSASCDWVIGAAVLTIFVEGSVKDRDEIMKPSAAKTAEDIEEMIRRHTLVRHYGVPTDKMDLIRAHQAVESGHRHDAYKIVIGHARSAASQRKVLTALERSLTLWLHYRDGVAKACRLRRP